MNTHLAADVVDDLPQGARAVVWYLEQRGGSVTRQELVDETWLTDRTVDRALARLEELDVVRRDRLDDDLRCVRVSFIEENPSVTKSDASER